MFTFAEYLQLVDVYNTLFYISNFNLEIGVVFEMLN